MLDENDFGHTLSIPITDTSNNSNWTELNHRAKNDGDKSDVIITFERAVRMLFAYSMNFRLFFRWLLFPSSPKTQTYWKAICCVILTPFNHSNEKEKKRKNEWVDYNVTNSKYTAAAVWRKMTDESIVSQWAQMKAKPIQCWRTWWCWCKHN